MVRRVAPKKTRGREASQRTTTRYAANSSARRTRHAAGGRGRTAPQLCSFFAAGVGGKRKWCRTGRAVPRVFIFLSRPGIAHRKCSGHFDLDSTYFHFQLDRSKTDGLDGTYRFDTTFVSRQPRLRRSCTAAELSCRVLLPRAACAAHCCWPRIELLSAAKPRALEFFSGRLGEPFVRGTRSGESFSPSAGRCISSERAAVYSDNRLYGCPRVEAEMKLFSCVFFQLFKKREVEKLLRKSCPILTGGNSMHWLCERSH
jgi:hypothetical protein